MFTKRLFVTTALCSIAIVSLSGAAEPDVVIQRTSQSTAVFAGKLSEINVAAESRISASATLTWSLVVSGAVVVRGEKAVELVAEGRTDIGWPIDVPPVKPGLVAAGKLMLVLKPQPDSVQFEPTQSVIELSVCSPEITALRQSWLKSLDLVLFDPEGRTAEVFDRSKIHFRQVHEAHTLANSTKLIVYGEGLDGEQCEAVWHEALKAAEGGRRVLVMSSAGPSVPLEGLLLPSNNGLKRQLLQGNETIHQFDNRLSSTDWPTSNPLTAVSIHWGLRRQQPAIEFRADDTGWSYLELQFRTQGRLIWVGWNLVDAWDATPSARYTLLKLFEQLSTDQSVVKGEDHDQTSARD